MEAINVSVGLELLGHRVKEKIGNVTGVVTSVCIDLYGCLQVLVTPEAKENNYETVKSWWFDTSRIEVLSTTPIIAPPVCYMKPTVGKPIHRNGPADKPSL